MIYVFDSPNAMPRYYKDKIYSNKHEREKVVRKAMDYSDRHPSVPCPIAHERLLKKLNRKSR